jgi:5-methylcytosine-specific restriction endonuclease McrA
LFQKQGRIRLEGDEYRKFCREIHTRDGWQCRRCGRRHQLQVHHLVKRSKVRLDTRENCLSLCATCHQLVEDKKVLVYGDNANEQIVFRRKE